MRRKVLQIKRDFFCPLYLFMQLLLLVLFIFHVYKLSSSVFLFPPKGLHFVSFACLLALSSFNFCLSENVISPFIKDSFAGYRILSWCSFSFSSLNIPSHCFLVFMVYDEKSALTYWWSIYKLILMPILYIYNVR